MNNTVLAIAKLLKKYGRNFFAKCPLYKTAKCGNEYVSLLSFDPNDLSFYVEFSNGTKDVKCVIELDEFVL